MPLSQHLAGYGIVSFNSDAYWDWALALIGEEKAREIDSLREPFFEEGFPAAESMRGFYDALSRLGISGPVHSMRADAIRASGEAALRAAGGRKRILDLGCGTGYLTSWYAVQIPSAKVTGVDFSGEAVREAEARSRELGIQNVSFLCEDLRRMKWKENWDAVIDTQTLYNIKERACILKDIIGHLGPEGVFVSIPAIGTAGEAEVYAAEIREGGLTIASSDFIFYEDLGLPGAYPVIVAGKGREGIQVNWVRAYAAALKKVTAGRS